MPIEVRHDPDYMAAYAQLASMRRQQQQAQAPQGYINPETDANPFTMSKQKGAQIDAQLRADRDGLAKKQQERYGDRQDSYAGFNWQNPIQIRQTGADGRGQYLTMYENLGVDPLATGGFGALGTRETRIDDFDNMIDPNNMKDRGALSKIVQSRQNMNILGDEADMFRSPEEIEQRKYDKQQGRKQEEFTQQLETRDVYDAKKKTRDLENKQAEDQSAVDAYQGIMDQQNDQDGVSSAEKSRLKAEMANIRKAIMKNPELKAKALPMLKRAYEQYLQLDKPVDQWAQEETVVGPNGEQIAVQRNARTGQMQYRNMGGAPKTQWGDVEEYQDAAGNTRYRQQSSTGQLRSGLSGSAAPMQKNTTEPLRQEAIRQLTTTDMFGEKKYPTDSEVEAYVKGQQGVQQRLKSQSAPPQNYTPIQAAVSSGRGQVESDPIKVTSIEDVGSLPSGTYFQDPEGNLRRVP